MKKKKKEKLISQKRNKSRLVRNPNDILNQISMNSKNKYIMPPFPLNF